MKIKIENDMVVTKDQNDEAVPVRLVNGAGESLLLYRIKQALNLAAGSNVFIKKRMYKDGHMVDDLQQYIRTAGNGRKGLPHVYLYSPHWATRGLDQVWADKGEVVLHIEYDVFGKQGVEESKLLLDLIVKQHQFKTERIRISARRWFQRSYGNTYHSCYVSVGGEFVGKVENTYGYGEHYLQTAHAILHKAGYCGGDYGDFRMAMRDYDRWYISCADVDRMRDLIL